MTHYAPRMHAPFLSVRNKQTKQAFEPRFAFFCFGPVAFLRDS